MTSLLFIDIYRNAFTKTVGDVARWNNTPQGQWDDATFYLYIFLILFVWFCGWVSDNRKIGNYKKNTKAPFVLAASFLTAILGFRGQYVGIDTPVYRISFETALAPHAFQDETTEPIYQALLKILRFFFESPEIAIFIFSFFTIFFVFQVLWKYRNVLSLAFAFSFYVGLFFFQSMNLLRIYFAASLSLLLFPYIVEGKYKKFLIGLLFFSLIHYSTISVLLVVVFLWLYQKNKIAAIFTYVIGFVILVGLANHFSQYMMIARYAQYGEGFEGSDAIGFKLIFDYLPPFVMVIYIYNKKIKGQWADLAVAYTLIGFLYRYLSYYMPAGRIKTHFLPLFVIIVPYFLCYMRKENRKLYRITALFLSIWLIVMIHFYLVGYLSTDGIMPYNFAWFD